MPAALNRGSEVFCVERSGPALLAQREAIGEEETALDKAAARLVELLGEDDAWRDAEPGKILHELRVGELAGAGLLPHTPCYGSVDATPC